MNVFSCANNTPFSTVVCIFHINPIHQSSNCLFKTFLGVHSNSLLYIACQSITRINLSFIHSFLSMKGDLICLVWYHHHHRYHHQHHHHHHHRHHFERQGIVVEFIKFNQSNRIGNSNRNFKWNCANFKCDYMKRHMIWFLRRKCFGFRVD